MSNSTIVKRLGRKPSANSLKFKTVGMTSDQWDWLQLWFPDGNPTNQLSELIDRSRKFWPNGPAVFR